MIEERLAACVQLWPVKSIYSWKGGVESSHEFALQFKTVAGLATTLCTKIRSQHPYEIPEILILTVSGGLPDYLHWVASSTRNVARRIPKARAIRVKRGRKRRNHQRKHRDVET